MSTSSSSSKKVPLFKRKGAAADDGLFRGRMLPPPVASAEPKITVEMCPTLPKELELQEPESYPKTRSQHSAN